jgi:tripartite ATP-independent transporter DctP family solute receptor
MKKFYTMVLAACAVGMVLTGCQKKESGGAPTAAPAAAAQPVIVQVGYENAPDSSVDLAMKEWQRLIEQKSGGKMKIELFPSSQLGAKNDLIDQMLAGMNVVTLADGAFLADRGAPDMGVVFAPYLFANWDEVWTLLKSDWWKQQEKLIEGKGIKIIMANYIYGERHTNTKKPIRAVSDFAGVKLRVPNNTIQIKGTEIMGATPTPMALGEVYTSIQTGVIDGMENPLTTILDQKTYEVAKNVTLDGHIKNFSTWMCGVQFFNSLTPEQQKWLVESGTEAAEWNNKNYEKDNAAAIQRLRDAGVNIIDTIDIASFQAKAKGFYDMPEIKALFSPGIYEAVTKAKGGK